MSANQPVTGEGGVATKAVYTGAEPNALLTFLQRPRIMLIMLAVWSGLTVAAQIFTNNAIFFDNHNHEIDGALGGFALGFEGIPLAAAYIYALRDPARHHAVFQLGLIQMAAMATSQVFHLGTGDFSIESVIIPLLGSIGLGVLVFLHLFAQKPAPTTVIQKTD